MTATAGKVAVVTGASSGLGRHFARLLAEQGVAVALMARREDRLADEVAAIEAAGGRAVALPLDVSDAAAIGPALDAAEAALGPISIMVNNAGVGGEGAALDMTVQHYDNTFDVNVRGVFFGAREAARCMIASGVAEAGEARIVNIASIAAFETLPGLSVYCASKAAVVALTKSLAREWARRGIAVNAICPGYVETEINADWFATEGGQKQINGFPRRRLMDISALDDAFRMLTGTGARYITGTAVAIDDGQTL